MIPDWVWLVATLLSSPVAWMLWAASRNGYQRVMRPLSGPEQARRLEREHDDAQAVISLVQAGDATISSRQLRRAEATIQRGGLGDPTATVRALLEQRTRDLHAAHAEVERHQKRAEEAERKLAGLERDLAQAADAVVASRCPTVRWHDMAGRQHVRPATEAELAAAVDFPLQTIQSLGVPPALFIDETRMPPC